MTTDFYDKEYYHVRGDKCDECPAFYGASVWEEILLVILILGGIGTILILTMIAILDPNLAKYPAIIAAIFFSCVVSTLYYIRYNSGKCGMIVYLKNRRDIIAAKVYHFTDNPSYDAMMVARIVKKFSDIAEKKHLEDESWRIAYDLKDKKRKEKSAECCTRYKEVIEKVKPEEQVP